jgi:hypothetical protein
VRACGRRARAQARAPGAPRRVPRQRRHRRHKRKASIVPIDGLVMHHQQSTPALARQQQKHSTATITFDTTFFGSFVLLGERGVGELDRVGALGREIEDEEMGRRGSHREQQRRRVRVRHQAVHAVAAQLRPPLQRVGQRARHAIRQRILEREEKEERERRERRERREKRERERHVRTTRCLLAWETERGGGPGSIWGASTSSCSDAARASSRTARASSASPAPVICANKHNVSYNFPLFRLFLATWLWAATRRRSGPGRASRAASARAPASPIALTLTSSSATVLFERSCLSSQRHKQAKPTNKQKSLTASQSRANEASVSTGKKFCRPIPSNPFSERRRTAQRSGGAGARA